MKVLLLGDARCVHDDAERALALFTPDLYATTNMIGMEWFHVDHWFTLHPNASGIWPGIVQAMRRRLHAGLNRPVTWAHKQEKGIDRWTQDWAGSSGLLAVKGLMEIGCTHIVCAGVPMKAEQGHYYDDKNWHTATNYHRGWIRNEHTIKQLVRSMSGWTRELLGEPTAEWLAS